MIADRALLARDAAGSTPALSRKYPRLPSTPSNGTAVNVRKSVTVFRGSARATPEPRGRAI